MNDPSERFKQMVCELQPQIPYNIRQVLEEGDPSLKGWRWLKAALALWRTTWDMPEPFVGNDGKWTGSQWLHHFHPECQTIANLFQSIPPLIEFTPPELVAYLNEAQPASLEAKTRLERIVEVLFQQNCNGLAPEGRWWSRVSRKSLDQVLRQVLLEEKRKKLGPV